MYPYNYANIFLHASIPSKVVDFNLRDKVLFGKKVLFSTYTSNNEHDWAPVNYLNVLHHTRTQNQLRHFFLNILQKYYSSYLGYFEHVWHVWPFPSKIAMPVCRNFNVYLHTKT